MEITRRAAGGWTELVIVGRLDGYWAEHLDAGLTEAVRDGNHRLRLDLSDVSFLSSAGIGVLVKFYKRLVTIKGTLVIGRASPQVRTVLDMTRLSAMLVEQTASIEPATLTLGSTVVRKGVVCELFDLAPGARFRLTSIGGEHPVGSPEDRRTPPALLVCPQSTMALGIGAFGAAEAEGAGRFGEFLAVAGAATYLPADGTEVPDYLLASEAQALELKVARGLACDGRFARHLRFESTDPNGVVSLATLAALGLEMSGGGAAAGVLMAEASGLVGAALRRSPATVDTGDFFEFPSVRTRLAFTAERAFQGGLALVAGVVQRAGGPLPAAQLRPLDDDGALVGHFHAAAFPFRPFKKGRLELADTVRTLFEDQGVQGVLHLLNDDRPIVGVGQSEFTRGAFWIGAVDR
jgi:anti-anti-sigma factor